MLYFKDSRFPIQAATRCKALLTEFFPETADDIPHKDLTAFVLCAVLSWRDLKACWTNVTEPSALDEDTKAEVFQARRVEQVERASHFLTARGADPAAGTVSAFVRKWQPSARFPELDVENRFRCEGRGTGRERYCVFVLGFRHRTASLPTDEETQLILENVHWAAPQWKYRVRMMAGKLACDIIGRLKDDDRAAVGLRILRAVAEFDPYAKARLARLLTVGWSRKNRQHAWKLVIDASDADVADDDPCAALFYAELADAAAALSGSETPPDQAAKVVSILERAARMGHWKAAHYLFHYFAESDQVRSNDATGFVASVPDRDKAQQYASIAALHPYRVHELAKARAEDKARERAKSLAMEPGVAGNADEGGPS